MSVLPTIALSSALAFLTSNLQGCGGGGGPPSPAPAPIPPPNVAPDPANWTYVIPDSSNFHCIKRAADPPNKYANGFFMYRWSTLKEATSQKVNSDDFGDINPYYLLTELMTNTGTVMPASKQNGCIIPKCGENSDDCVLERVHIEMNNADTQELLLDQSIWGPYLSIDNGIPSQYSYWAFNWSHDATDCKKDQFTGSCNFYFKGGYPVGCQVKSDVMDNPVWYSTIAACPQYPFNPNVPLPQKVSSNFTWHGKLDMNDPAVQKCYKEMPGGNYCGGLDKKGRPKGTPWTTPGKTCTWAAKNAGYLTIEDIFNIPQPLKYHDWCLKQPDSITGYGSGTGIPWNITLFYNLSELAFPVLQGVSPETWHAAVSSDGNQLTPEQKAVFQNWAKWAKVRLEAMFTAMDNQSFTEFRRKNVTDPDGEQYKGCISNKDVVTPPCKNGLSSSRRAAPTITV